MTLEVSYVLYGRNRILKASYLDGVLGVRANCCNLLHFTVAPCNVEN